MIVENGQSFNEMEAAEACGLPLQQFVAKAKEYKIPGWKTGTFERAKLQKFFEIRDSVEFDSIVLAISNQKGGEGKTTLSLCLAEAFSEDTATLLIDWDPQANATRLFVKEEVPSVMEALGYRKSKKRNIEDLILEVKKNLFLLPSSIDLANLTTPYERDDFELLKDALLPIRSKFKYIIIDCPPSLGLILENAFIAADFIIVPVQTRAFSLQGLGDLYETFQKIQKKANPRLRMLGAILNQFEKQKALSGLAEGIKKYFPVFETTIARKESIPQAQARMSLLKKIDGDLMQSFGDLKNEILRRISKIEKERK